METESVHERQGLTRHLVRWLVRLYYPRLEINDADRIPQTGPVLLCANHANSLLDPVLIGIAARRPVRFMAKAPLFDVPVLGPLMQALGMVPAFRGSDDASQVRRNVESLDVGAKQLVDGHAMGIFPEGKSHDLQHVEMVRSGASRMAMQAVDEGVRGLKIVPIGVNYEDKERFRSMVWIRVGQPIDADAWLQQHDGDNRKAMRALTPELESRLKDVVIQLEEPQWEPWLADLEVLVPERAEVAVGRSGPLRQRKRIADAMNYFLANDRPRAEQIASDIKTFRDHVHAAGLRVHSPVLRTRGLSLFWMLLWKILGLLILPLPALAGTLHHFVPFVLVRRIAARIQAPGRTTVSFHRLAVGLPVYLLWYAGVGWWMFGYSDFAKWFTWTWLLTMPLAGVIALEYWRRARDATVLLWQQLLAIARRKQLLQLRAQRDELCRKLVELADEYARVSPRPAAASAPPRSAALWRWVAWIGVAVLMFASGWFARPWLFEKPMSELQQGLALSSIPSANLKAQLKADEKSLVVIKRGLDELQSRALPLRDEFAAGERNYADQADNDLIRQLFLSYLNYRTALLRLIWKYQRFHELHDEPQRLTAFMTGYTAAMLLYESSLKFVRSFDHPAAVAKLNEEEPVWGIPADVYDTIQRNLSSDANLDVLARARGFYREHESALKSHGLWDTATYDQFRAAIRQAEDTVAELRGSVWQERIGIAAKDLQKLAKGVYYDASSLVSTWIGDVKLREPRDGRSLISPQQVSKLQSRMKPGDIILERRNWYLSNAFLPGFWPHAALYVGTADDLKRLRLDQNEHVRARWFEFTRRDHDGHTHVIIEAISEGVVFSSIEHSIGGGDSAAVLRPQLSDAQKADAIARAFSHVGKPYDFDFDFTTTDKLVCTEVVFRSYDQDLDLNPYLTRIMGRDTMPAIHYVRCFADECRQPAPKLAFVAFIDGDEQTNLATFVDDPDALIRTLDRPGLTPLQRFVKE